ncbi:MFS transporter [Amycolatopsis rubida]|uniref:MFS transporter n=2 Tax=Pseudonocardiaceae TaxID=2070 RepID=A0ABX0BK58_9PSEU|nr:MFS transporter [Amycolatopsis rubida]NEC54680.1 MFS transporter [Amycolatopsis rubida]
MALGMLDSYIVATALPSIAADLGGPGSMTWIITAYALAIAASTQVWGKLSDQFDRKAMFLLSVAVFLTGSMLCGLAPAMGALIGFRALQGIGAGGLLVGAMAMVQVLVPPKESTRISSWTGLLLGLSLVGGPLAGGFLADAAAAPSSSNAQPWQVEVVSGAKGDELADALVAAHQEGRRSVDFPYSEAVHQKRRAAAGGALQIGFDDHEARAAYDAESLRFYGAPHVALLFAPDTAEARLAADVGMYGQALLLAMQAHGVSSCPQGLLSFYVDTVRETLGLERGKPLFGISFGYADRAAPVNRFAAGRVPLDETTRFHA